MKKKYLIWILCFLACIVCFSSYLYIFNKVHHDEIVQPEVDLYIEKISNIISSIQPKLDPEVCRIIAKTIIKYSKQYQLPPEFIICIIEQESTFRLTLTSSANCKGLMQINPSAHPEKLKKLKIKNGSIFYIDNNIQLGCMILREYYDRSNDIKKALESYVGASQEKYVTSILSKFASILIDGSEKEKVVESIPEKENKLKAEVKK